MQEPHEVYTLSLSYGKDSLACLGAIEELGWPLDRIVHIEVWATDTISADLPSVTEFKAKSDELILSRYGIKVEHMYVTNKYGEKQTYEKMFYKVRIRGKYKGRICGFPFSNAPECNAALKRPIAKKLEQDGTIQYVGIASDEESRFKVLSDRKVSPLVAAGWTESDCLQWCKDNDLLSPIYQSQERCGCWFCHNQTVDQLRRLRHEHPDLWSLLMTWDTDSPVSFKSRGRTIHAFDERFQMEDDGVIDKDDLFHWSLVLKS